ASGDTGGAISYATRAARIYGGTGYKLGEARALATLAGAHLRTGDHREATRHQNHADHLLTAVLTSDSDPPR
ncbi:MAG: hypothetical protein HOV96_22535, partial [Nonomuraea sp.]|nr:hypothetical protein [Nonomuraea sp.]